MESIRDMLRRAATERRYEHEGKVVKVDVLPELEQEGGILLRGCSYLGGCGYPLTSQNAAVLCFSPDALRVYCSNDAIYCATDLAFSVPYLELAQIGISGPGAVTTGEGFVGGGFGVVGAVEGMAIASALNALTTVSKIHTFITITTNIGELNFHYGSMEPGALRIALAPVFTTLRRLNPAWRQERLATLSLAQSEGAISQIEFDRLSQRLMASTVEPRANQVTAAG